MVLKYQAYNFFPVHQGYDDIPKEIPDPDAKKVSYVEILGCMLYLRFLNCDADVD